MMNREDYVKQIPDYQYMRETVKKDENRLHFHLMPPTGWMNDPNGLCEFQGINHIYFQYTPFLAGWGRRCIQWVGICGRRQNPLFLHRKCKIAGQGLRLYIRRKRAEYDSSGKWGWRACRWKTTCDDECRLSGRYVKACERPENICEERQILYGSGSKGLWVKRLCASVWIRRFDDMEVFWPDCAGRKIRLCVGMPGFVWSRWTGNLACMPAGSSKERTWLSECVSMRIFPDWDGFWK